MTELKHCGNCAHFNQDFHFCNLRVQEMCKANNWLEFDKTGCEKWGESIMATGQDFINLAIKHLGERYVYGADVALNDPKWHGPWDCAEFVTWVVKQVTGKIYGVTGDNDPWTGAWRRDVLNGKVLHMDIDDAIVTPGAILLCFSGEGHHIVFSVGDGKRCFGAQNHVAGVAYKNVWMMDWTHAIKIPGVKYGS